MSTTERQQRTRPYVTSYDPAANHRVMMRIGNACTRGRTRKTRRLGERMQGLSLLTVTGRRTGKRYVVPVSAIDRDGSQDSC